LALQNLKATYFKHRLFLSLSKFKIMRVVLIQSVIIWEDPQANRTYFEAEINTISGAVDLIVPEMFSTGFTMNPILQRRCKVKRYYGCNLCESQNAAITGSVVIKESDNYYNHLSFPSGEIQHYDKRHLFTLAGEDKVYTKEPKS
jgi:predicted amidohydrolase